MTTDQTRPARPSPAVLPLARAALRRDLTAFAAAVPRTPVEDRATWRALLRRWEVLAAALRTTGGAPDELGPLLTACRSGLQLLARGLARGDDRAALAVRTVAARECLARLATPADATADATASPTAADLAPVGDAVPWLLAGRRDAARSGAARRAAWWLGVRRLEALDRRAFRHAPDVV
ncbi:MAG: hypothetical protein ACXVEC_03550 [Nocardioides sp.]